MRVAGAPLLLHLRLLPLAGRWSGSWCLQNATAQHSTAQHSTAQHSTEQHTQQQRSVESTPTIRDSERRRNIHQSVFTHRSGNREERERERHRGGRCSTVQNRRSSSSGLLSPPLPSSLLTSLQAFRLRPQLHVLSAEPRQSHLRSLG